MRNVSSKCGGILWGFGVVVLGGVVLVVYCKVASLSCSGVGGVALVVFCRGVLSSCSGVGGVALVVFCKGVSSSCSSVGVC